VLATKPAKTWFGKEARFQDENCSDEKNVSPKDRVEKGKVDSSFSKLAFDRRRGGIVTAGKALF